MPIAIFGEIVLYHKLETATSPKEQIQPKMMLGIWLGILERIEEVIIGTQQGVIKCRVVNRLPENQRWNKDLVVNMTGSPWNLILRIKGDHIFVENKEDGKPTTPAEENVEEEEEIPVEEEINMPSKPATPGYNESGPI